MSLRSWKDREPLGRRWLVNLEFAVVGALTLASFALAMLSLIWSVAADALPGGLAADGCHNDRKNGGRHCHRTQSATPKER